MHPQPQPPDLITPAGAYTYFGEDLALEFDGTAPFTVEGWVWFAFPYASYLVFARPELLLGITADGHAFAQRHPAVEPLVGHRVVTPDTWFHLGLTFDGTRMALYVDGELDVESTRVDPTEQRWPRRRADQPSERASVSGDIAELRIWNRAWTPQRMAQAPSAVPAPTDRELLASFLRVG